MHIIYARVSTDDQVKGYSIDSQIDFCRTRFQSMGITSNIKVIIDEGYSGAFLERPGLSELRDLLAAKVVSTIIVYDPDRLSRELEHLLLLDREIRRSNVGLYFITGDFDATPTGKAFFQMRGVFAGFQREYIRENTMRGRRKKATSGKIVLNARPFGYDWDATNSMYVINPEQAAVVRLIYDLFLNQGIGCRAIAQELSRRGIIGPKGKPLSISTVNRILGKEMYSGQHYLYRQSVKKIGQNKREIRNVPKDQWIPVTIPAIVSKDLWERAQSRLELNRKQAKRNCSRYYLLKDILKCGFCGHSLMGITRPGSPRKMSEAKMYSYYVCVTKESPSYTCRQEKCQCRRIPVEEFDQIVWNIFLSVAKKEISFSAFMEKLGFPDYSSEIEQLSQHCDELMKRHGQIAALIMQGLLDADAAKTKLKAANKEIAAAKSSLQSLITAQKKTQKMASNITTDEILNAATFEEKRRILLDTGFQVYAMRRDDRIEFYMDN
jgi:DNA invertase Pin-like site-specific DNA recombinase